MERNNIETQDYDLRADRALKMWFVENVQPILEEYVGFRVGWPWAHIRYVNAARHGDGSRKGIRETLLSCFAFRVNTSPTSSPNFGERLWRW